MSAPRTASAAESASRTPIRSPACLQLHAPALRKQDVPGGDGIDAHLAQAGGERLAGFAEADEAQAGHIATRHVVPFSFR